MTRGAATAASMALVACALVAGAGRARAQSADPLDADAILGRPRPYVIESVRTRYSHLDQQGHGFQSQADPAPAGPGSEALTVDEPQLEVVARQGDRLTHRLWVPVDIVTAASPDALDAVSTASRQNEAGTFALDSTYQATRATAVSGRGGFHIEENFRSWNLGAGVVHSFADDNAVLAVSVNQVLDYFDRYNTRGVRLGRVERSSSNANIGLTQLLSPTTVANINYGVTLQTGELGNTWNAVPLATGGYTVEGLPRFRQRHAFVAKLAQYLPWQGALHLSYRFYVDDWGLLAHTAEAALFQRILPWWYLRLSYRVHQQNGVSFFTTRAQAPTGLRSADSDLAPLVAQTFGVATAVDLGFTGRLRGLHADFGYERYLRSNDLRIDSYTVGLGFTFN